MSRSLGVIIFPDFQILDATGPIAAFEIAARISQGAYALEVLSAEGGPVASTSGVHSGCAIICTDGSASR